MGYYQKLKSFINAYSLNNLIAHCESFIKNFAQSSLGGGGIFAYLIWILFLFAVTIFLKFLYFLKNFLKNISELLKNIFRLLRALLTISMGEISIYWENVNSSRRSLKVNFENIIENMINGIENLYGKIIEDTYVEKNTVVLNSHPITTLFLMFYWIFLFVLSIAMSILLILSFLTPFPFLHQSIRRLIFGEETAVSKNSLGKQNLKSNNYSMPRKRVGLESHSRPHESSKRSIPNISKPIYYATDQAHSQIEINVKIQDNDNEKFEEQHSNISINQELSYELAVQYYQNADNHQTLNKYTQGYYSATVESLAANRRYSAKPLDLTESNDYNGLFWIIKTSENYFLMFPNPKMRIDQTRIQQINYFFSSNFRDSNYVACEVGFPADMRYESDKWIRQEKGQINFVY